MAAATSTRIRRLFRETFDEFLRVPVTIVAVYHGVQRDLPPDVLQYFRDRYGADFATGQIDTLTLPSHDWLAAHVKPVRPDLSEWSGAPGLGGLYLFLDGKSVAHHPLETPLMTTFRLVIKDNGGSNAILDHFVPLVRARADQRARSQQASRPAPSEAGVAAFAQACVRLGVPTTITLEELSKVHRQKIAETHPDKVAHAGDAFIRLATKETKELNTAYALIRDTLEGRK